MNLEQATKRLLIRSPFYGLFLLSLKGDLLYLVMIAKLRMFILMELIMN